MSDSDSFIAEVSEEVRRDRLFAMFKKWGWVPAVLIVSAVGYTAWSEWSKSSAQTQARVQGDALMAARKTEEPQAQAQAFGLIAGKPGSVAVVARMDQAAALLEAGEKEAALAALEAVAADDTMPSLYRELARLKAVILQGAQMDPAERQQALAELSLPGATFRLIALEQSAMALLDQKDSSGALIALTALLDEAGVSETQRNRISQLIVALGGGLPDVNITDTGLQVTETVSDG